MVLICDSKLLVPWKMIMSSKGYDSVQEVRMTVSVYVYDSILWTCQSVVFLLATTFYVGTPLIMVSTSSPPCITLAYRPPQEKADSN